ncbi:MAG: YdcF family protein [Clostridia bacterium]|nr:YdcF family protein [Clostridia bacterium]
MLKWRLPLLIFSGILLVWGILPYWYARIRGVGVITPMVIGFVGLIAGIFPRLLLRLIDAVRQSGRVTHIVVMVLGVLVAVLILLFLVVSVLMICGALDKVPSGEPVTVVVLGAQINGESPSRMLGDRLKAAIKVLEENPEAVCVVSGGQGPDEIVSEAVAMKKYLVAAGVEPARVFLEDRSINTMENMKFTAEVIAQNNLPEQVVIATQEFHQFRSAAYGRAAGLSPVGAAVCGTPWYLFLCYWVREFAGICRMWLLHY